MNKALLDHQLFKSGPMVLFVWTNAENWPVERVSENVYGLLGYATEMFTSGELRYSDLIHPDDLPRVFSEVTDAMNSATCQNFLHQPYRLKKADGNYIWVKDYTNIVTNSQGEIIQFVGYIFDITGEVKTKDDADSYKKRLELVWDTIEDGLWDWDIENNQVYYSNRWKSMLGYTPEEFENDPARFFDAIHPNDVNTLKNTLQKHFETPEKVPFQLDVRVRCKSGDYKRILTRGKAFFNEHGLPIRMVGSHSDLTEQLKQAQLTQDLLEKQQAVFDTADSFIIVTDSTGIITHVNRAVEQVFGYVAEELIGHATPLVLLDKQEVAERALDYANETGQPLDVGFSVLIHKTNLGWVNKDEWAFVSQTGKHVPVLLSVNALNDGHGSITGYVFIATDVSLQQQALQQAKKAEQKFFTLFEESLDGLVILDSENLTPIAFNKVAHAQLGYSREAFQSLLAANIQPQLFADLTQHLNKLKTQGWDQFETKLYHHDGHWKDFSINLSKLELDDKLVYYCVFRDISKQKATQKALEDSEKLLKDAQQIAKLGSWTLLVKENQLYWTDQVYEIFEMDAQSVRLSYDVFLSRIHPEDVEIVQEAFETSIQNRTKYSIEHRLLMPDARVKYVLEKGRHFYDDAGNIVQTQGTVQDITHYVSLQKALLESKEKADAANQAKSNFLANMSHEIRTPLNGIIGITDLVLQTQLQPMQKKYLQNSQSASYALLNIINDILDYSKIEAGKLDFDNKPFQTERLLSKLSDLFSFKALENGLNLLFDMDAQLPEYLNADEFRISQILNNLVGNAIKFTPSGFVLVSIKQLKRVNQQVNIQFTIQDSGVGLTLEQQQKLFNPFSQGDASITRKYGGTGLGLKISKQLVELMGGRIWIDSQENEGTIVHFNLLLDYDDRNAQKALAQPLAHQQIMLINESELENELLANQLSAWGANVECYTDALSAINVLHQGQFDTVFCAVSVSSENFEHLKPLLLQKTHELNRVVKVLIISDFNHNTLSQNFNLTGIENLHILSKPYTPSAILSSMQQVTSIENYEQENTEQYQGKVLLVDDNEINRLVTLGILKLYGLTASVAQQGAIAVEMVQKESFDLILMDLHMPVMDGYEATKQIRTFNANVPIVALSAAAMESDVVRSKSVGMNAHLAKPLARPELEVVLKQYLKNKGSKIQPKEGGEVVSHPASELFNRAALLKLLSPNQAYDLLTSFIQTYQGWSQKLNQFSQHQFNIELHALKGTAGNLQLPHLFQAAKVCYEESNAERRQLRIENLMQVLAETLDYLQLEGIKGLKKVSSDSENMSQTDFDHLLDEMILAVQNSQFIEEESQAQLIEQLTHYQGVEFADWVERALSDLDYELALNLLAAVKEKVQPPN